MMDLISTVNTLVQTLIHALKNAKQLVAERKAIETVVRMQIADKLTIMILTHNYAVDNLPEPKLKALVALVMVLLAALLPLAPAPFQQEEEISDLAD